MSNTMKRFTCLTFALILLSPLIIAGCSTEINESEAYLRNDLLYRKGADKPFSGVVVGKSIREGYRRMPVTFKKEYKKGQLHGRSFYYYDNGKIESIEPYENGVLNGVVTRYYKNGQIKARLHFVDGFRGGSKGEMFWDEEGNKIRR